MTDTAGFGHPELVADQVPPEAGFEADATEGAPIPAVISADLIDMYNTGFAKTNDLPQLTPEILSGQQAILYLGSSSFRPGPEDRVRPVPVRMIGVSDRVPLVGVSLPRALVERWNRDLAGESTPQYIQLTVVVARAQEVERSRRESSPGLAGHLGREIAHGSAP